MLQVNLPVVDKIHLKDNKFVTCMKFKASHDSKLNDIPNAKMRKHTSGMGLCIHVCFLPSSLRGLLWSTVLFAEEEFDRYTTRSSDPSDS